MKAIPDDEIIGQRFGRLVGIGLAQNKGSTRRGHFRCDCGEDRVLPLSSVRSGRTRSCGCFRLERSRRKGKNATHGECHKTGEHRSWQAMRARCLNPAHQAFHNYGGRGITVCARWESYEDFLTDMGRRPTKRHTLDRIDNDQGYEPGNCRWATKKEQLRNTRFNRMVEFRGETMCMTELAERFGRSHQMVNFRLKNGWSLEDALTIEPYCERKSSV